VQRIVAEIDGLRLVRVTLLGLGLVRVSRNETHFLLGFVGTPGFAPEPLLRKGEDGHLVLGIVGQVLVQIGQRVRVAGELVVDRPQSVAHHLASGVSRERR
jgi:hypothetical protein